ncbi:NAD(P)-dependent oxidoreductase [Pelagibius sp. Alg239-R121]|uniref:NAD-binding protein n=1 Tax=Pelagibius sp. Alg239-R121 TaxID=2993448 RepID=UPI0024A6E232|nr:NAD(P)-dependent oxidoreductase [Pelagibius sp. Alg239-R121]
MTSPSHGPFQAAYDLFPEHEIPFLQSAKKRLERARPYEGLKILHNIPLTMESLHKVHALLLGGAEISVTSPSFMEPKADAIAVMKAAGVPVLLANDPLPSEVDVTLDCAGELIDRVTPRIGAVELTGTGTQRYLARTDLNYPVISVDQSSVKNLEALLGTGDAFVRAFVELTGESLKARSVMLFGFGKVGQGIAHALAPSHCQVTIVETDPHKIGRASRAGYVCIDGADRASVEQAAREAFVVVTATGRKGIVSELYDPTAFRNAAYLANMGGEDEFGSAFSASEIMVEKKPINFAIDHPTQIRYLDPVFHAHNLGIELLLFANLAPGHYAFPEFIAEEITSTWQSLFNLDISSLLAQ